MTWWADGFVAEGYKAFPYEGTDGPKAARELLAALGRSTWLESPSKWYLTFNAARMLKRLPLADVRKAMGEALKGESPAEKRGLARYTEDLSRAEGEPMLKALAADGDRSVRLAATGQICGNLVEHWPVGDNDPVWRPCTRGQVPPEVLAAATGPSTTAPVVVFPRAGRSSEVRRPAEVSKAIRETPTPLPGTVATGTHGNIGWRIRVEGLKPQPPDPNAVRDEPYVLHVEGSSLQAGRKVYSRQLANSRAGQADSVCWLLDAPSGRLYVSIHTYTAAIEVETGEVIWEVGVGATSSDDLNLLGPFLVVSPWCRGLIIFGAEGDIVASRGRRDVRLDPARLRLFDGRVWAQDSDGRWCVLDFSDTHAPWSEPAEQEPSAPTPGTGH
jgi:hypothetical protein